ncbi:transmembrane protein 120 homolog isoform X2 [Portunus trituberculatus]|uniref:transmembrane protein 120 homolog isoform X2 n=1 Tax=Portunus trituberculatus TaxID=210409 RepID=UPI001E1CF692|nr:transmembrane protein 120 homolog isoform X2 [Portunus trituberculatus]
MEHNDIDACIEEWETLSNEYRALEKIHKEYRQKLEELTQLQTKCTKGIAHQRYRINIIKQSLKKLDHTNDPDNSERNELLQTDLIRRKAQLYDMENSIPKPNGTYLKIILGNINVSILNKEEKYRYKDEYEKFKLVINLVAIAISTFNLLTNFRTADLLHMFLLVWYYCTLTIRESILKVNGSRIKGWWRAHHFISTVLSGILLIWPNGETYYAFRRQFMLFNIYISFVQYLMFMYQRGCLYRLKALGERHNMDITVEGFHFWMWRGLGFIIPFLLIGYIWELYNAYTLYLLSFSDKAEWHVITLAALFLLLFLGNTLTTLSVIPQKLKERMKFKYRFTRLDKYIWTHKKRRVSFRNPESPQRRTPAARAASFSRKRPGMKEEEEAPQVMPSSQVNGDENTSNENGDDGTNLNEMLNDITKDIDFEKVDQENEDESGQDETSNEENTNGEEEEESDKKQENDTETETKKEK